MNTIQMIDGLQFTPSKIIGIGRNYVKHIKEMHSTQTEEPVLFIKPNSSLHDITRPIPIPKTAGSVHHEIELAVLIGKDGKNISEQSAMNYVFGYGLALDLTLRDVQNVAKDAGLPWALAKGFDHSCPVSTFFYRDKIEDPHNLNLKFIVNTEIKQDSNTNLMIFKIPLLISYISQFFTLNKGDIIITGTPAGVGPLKADDIIEASIEGIIDVRTSIV
jgi:2-keto-4-pentenoate hydratase/2-oxohepta-3-ene-1,7-dioic acid hydratase in catechol pathway